MLRQLQVVEHKPVIANCFAQEDLVPGMGVIIDYQAEYENNITDALPISHWDESGDIYFADKERSADGIFNAVDNHSDYDDNFQEICKYDPVKIIIPMPGELYATDQYASDLIDSVNVGDRLIPVVYGKEGGPESLLWTNNNAYTSRFVFEGFMADGEKVLIKIRILSTPKAPDM